MMKVLLVGIGRWGANHLRALHSLPIELFVAELDAKRLESAKALGIDGWQERGCDSTVDFSTSAALFSCL